LKFNELLGRYYQVSILLKKSALSTDKTLSLEAKVPYDLNNALKMLRQLESGGGREDDRLASARVLCIVMGFYR